MKNIIGVLILSIASVGFTVWGVYMLFTGQITNGLLAIIVGELIDMPHSRLNTPEEKAKT